jgi:hypothetical protein
VNWLIATFGTNWKTTLGGILFAVPGIITAAAVGAGVHLSPIAIMVLTIVTSLGGLLIGVTAKDSTTHSTPLQVQAAGATVIGDPKAPAMVKAADAQAATGKETPK